MTDIDEGEDRCVVTGVSSWVGELMLNRPQRHNALDAAMFEEIPAAAQGLRRRPDVRAIVVSGRGPSFCAGIDLDYAPLLAAEARAGAMSERSADGANRFQAPALALRNASVPVIAALRGVTYGGGLQIALAADVRLAAPDATFSVMELRWALVPDMGGTWMMAGLLRDDVVRDLVFSAHVVGAEDALRLGLVTRIVADPLGEARSMAAQIATRSPAAVAAAKRLLNGVRAEGQERLLAAEAREQETLLAGGDPAEALLARAERREPRFPGPHGSGG